jgi:cellulose synthase/poly-beta-1,6-N-acetylglucosamine synthase-like glycosyltransferase
MIVYTWFVIGFFTAFILVNSAVLLLAGAEVRRYVARSSSSSLRRMLQSPLTPGISVLVPAYNEAAGIVDSVRSLLALDYREVEVIVISDGSTDDTVGRLVDDFDLREVTLPAPPFLSHEPVRAIYAPPSQLSLLVIDKENGGKADSLNVGINYASYPLFCTVDADSILEQDALAKAALPFVEDPVRTVAAGGMVRVANGCRVERGRVMEAHLPRAPLAMFQVVEYVRGFFGTRTGWSAINALLIVSGAFGLFRRDTVIAAGGYRTGMVGEDLELITRLHRYCRLAGQPYRIVYVPDPVCWTEAPEKARFLRRQRQRWYRGCVETLFMHRGMIGNPRYRGVGLVALPTMLIFEIIGPVVELSGYVVTIVAVILGAINPVTFLLFVLISVLYGQVLTAGAVLLEDVTPNQYPVWAETRRVRWYAWLENLGYRQVMQYWRIGGLWQIIRGSGWGTMERTGLSD